ncbi:MAG: cytosine methyltransferase [Patescibacteria group bacterium]|nr:cytosine methyltransferase [Patescibacteria group bacterium]
MVVKIPFMGIINGIQNKEKRRFLRKNQTLEEEFVWRNLRGNKMGMKWRRQVSIGQYVADFYCTARKLVLEIDGDQHLAESARGYDEIRTHFFEINGIKVIRISNKELNSDPQILYQKIKDFER